MTNDGRVDEGQLCRVPPSPQLRQRIKTQLADLAGTLAADSPVRTIVAPEPMSPGLNDGLIIPGDRFPLGTPLARVRGAALERAPLRGDVRVIVVLVDFDDQEMNESVSHFEELFFSTDALPHGSVKEYFTEVSNGLVNIVGEVVGPYRLPKTMAAYAHGDSGTGAAEPNARTMARHAAEAADADVDFKPYDNDGNGFVDAFIVLHAGPGAEQSGSPGQIWSHKWVLARGEYRTDDTSIFAYLTVPEDSRIGVCAHEIGHLVMGWPDLYDADGGSEGVGDWCLMAGGSWNADGDIPAHPSAWCKVTQGWASVTNHTTDGPVDIVDVKDGQTVHRLWKDGGDASTAGAGTGRESAAGAGTGRESAAGAGTGRESAAGAGTGRESKEYFLVENRQKKGYDAELPGAGLLVWHIDDAIEDNTNSAHYKVALVQADGRKDLESGSNRGDAGDSYPGEGGNTAFTNSSTPNSKSYGGLDTGVGVTSIPAPAPTMSVDVTVV